MSGSNSLTISFYFHRELFCRAVLELGEVLMLYSRASKPVQKQCVADTVSALWLCDWSSFQARAVATLVSSIEQNLPKAKREACLRECKQAKLSHHRKVKRGAGMQEQSLMDLLPNHLLVSYSFLSGPVSEEGMQCL